MFIIDLRVCLDREATIREGACISRNTVCGALKGILYQATMTFKHPKKRASENIMGKGENAGNQHFLLFPQCFQKPPHQGG